MQKRSPICPGHEPRGFVLVDIIMAMFVLTILAGIIFDLYASTASSIKDAGRISSNLYTTQGTIETMIVDNTISIASNIILGYGTGNLLVKGGTQIQDTLTTFSPTAQDVPLAVAVGGGSPATVGLLYNTDTSRSLTWLPEALEIKDSVTNQSVTVNCQLNGITWGGSDQKWVAVGGNPTGTTTGRIFTSTNAQNWSEATFQSTPPSKPFYGVAWGGKENDKYFVAVGEAGIYFSTDGKTDWQAATLTGGPYVFQAVTWGGPPDNRQFVAVGKANSTSNNLTIFVSPDGITWTQQSKEAGNTDSVDLFAVAWGNGRFLAVGCYNGSPIGYGRVLQMKGTDLASGIWSKTSGVFRTSSADSSSLANTALYCVTTANNLFYAAGKSGLIYVYNPSTNVWLSQTQNTGQTTIKGLLQVNSLTVSANGNTNGGVSFSTNGASWKPLNGSSGTSYYGIAVR